MKNKIATTICLILILLPLSVWAQTASEKGLEIAQEAERRDTGWVDQIAGLQMILRNRCHGAQLPARFPTLFRSRFAPKH